MSQKVIHQVFVIISSNKWLAIFKLFYNYTHNYFIITLSNPQHKIINKVIIKVYSTPQTRWTLSCEISMCGNSCKFTLKSQLLCVLLYCINFRYCLYTLANDFLVNLKKFMKASEEDKAFIKNFDRLKATDHRDLMTKVF